MFPRPCEVGTVTRCTPRGSVHRTIGLDVGVIESIVMSVLKCPVTVTFSTLGLGSES